MYDYQIVFFLVCCVTYVMYESITIGHEMDDSLTIKVLAQFSNCITN